MRVLFFDEQVIDVESISGNLEEYGAYTLYFGFYGQKNEGMQFEYQGISVEEAKERATKIIKEAYEKGFVDCSNEPWDII
jgi:nitrogen regulatory protein PII-like uncharacterized protein